MSSGKRCSSRATTIRASVFLNDCSYMKKQKPKKAVGIQAKNSIRRSQLLFHDSRSPASAITTHLSQGRPAGGCPWRYPTS